MFRAFVAFLAKMSNKLRCYLSEKCKRNALLPKYSDGFTAICTKYPVL